MTAQEVDAVFNTSPFSPFVWGSKVPDRRAARAVAVHTGLLPFFPAQAPACTACGNRMSRVRRSDRSTGFMWYCPRPCRRRVGFRINTWFAGSRLSMRRIWQLVVCWFFQTPVTKAAWQVGVTQATAVDWYSFCREVCAVIMHNENYAVGGVGLHVEVDETHLFRRRYNVGRILAHQDVWVFGGICRETKEAFCQLIDGHPAIHNIDPVIAERIVPGSIICHDNARVYDNLHQGARGGWQHLTVNHSRNFVDPNNPNAHTNTVERMWREVKRNIRGFGDDDHLGLYLCEYMYRRRYCNPNTVREGRQSGRYLRIFLDHVRQVYPGPEKIGLAM